MSSERIAEMEKSALFLSVLLLVLAILLLLLPWELTLPSDMVFLRCVLLPFQSRIGRCNMDCDFT